ncbi:TetR-like C-terminal domain-containing protein [Salinispora cortesiana]|uniref:TetR-like C-terminal domain-containing protein n=1 Tax=Salinispora cortesiana TaxID=1305843 RepID=UPI000470C63B|nr:TetR-like C-terminal domain-containing protein [Salinispora cortesiana]
MGSGKSRIQHVPEDIKREAYGRLALSGPEVLVTPSLAETLGLPREDLLNQFPNSNSLLTALVLQAYEAMGASAEKGATDAREKGLGLLAQWISACDGMRSWAQANPAEYTLIWGPPRPGYCAPPETVIVGARAAVILVDILRRATEARRIAAPGPADLPLSPGMRCNVRNLANGMLAGLADDLIARLLVTWTQLLGMISYTVYGHANEFAAPDAFFEHAATTMGRFVGITEDEPIGAQADWADHTRRTSPPARGGDQPHPGW